MNRVSIFTAVSICLGANSHAGETLHNGIVLPDEWPPNRTTFPNNDPIPPYLKQPPTVIPIDVGRQLFFDDFLIESTDMTRTHHRPEYDTFMGVSETRGGGATSSRSAASGWSSAITSISTSAPVRVIRN